MVAFFSDERSLPNDPGFCSMILKYVQWFLNCNVVYTVSSLVSLGQDLGFAYLLSYRWCQCADLRCAAPSPQSSPPVPSTKIADTPAVPVSVWALRLKLKPSHSGSGHFPDWTLFQPLFVVVHSLIVLRGSPWDFIKSNKKCLSRKLMPIFLFVTGKSSSFLAL